MSSEATHMDNEVRVTIEDRGKVAVPSFVRSTLWFRVCTVLGVVFVGGKVVLKPRRRVSAKDLLGIAGSEPVELKDIRAVGRP
jgi:bifunctional DNA-binding transcriptional regulator/antitoxin component of YhaV-PrlF toxin-antitoxin module